MSVFKLTGLKGCLRLICTSLRMFEQRGSFLSFSGILESFRFEDENDYEYEI